MRALLRDHPQFRRLWCAQVVSGAGDWLNRVALLTLIGTLSGPRAAVGVGALFAFELAVRFLPVAVVGPLAGPLADRLPRRLLMVTTDVARTVVVLGYLFIDEPAHLPWLYGLLALQMAFSIVFDAARSAAVPDTVPKPVLHLALALSAATWSAMLTLGAAVGGLLVEVVGVRGVFLLDAASYLGSAWFLRRLHLPPVPEHPEPFRWRDVVGFVELRRGLAHARDLGLVPVLLTKSFWWPCGGFLVMLSVVGHERFGEGGALAVAGAGSAGLATGLLYGARGLGTGLGPILARRWMGSGDEQLLRQILLGFAVAITGYALFATAGSLVVGCLWVFAAHLGGSTIWIASTTFWQRRVDGAFRGRVYAVEFLCMTLTFAGGGLLAGQLYDRTGSIEGTVWVLCGALTLFAAAWWRQVRAVPRRPVEEAPATGP